MKFEMGLIFFFLLSLSACQKPLSVRSSFNQDQKKSFKQNDSKFNFAGRKIEDLLIVLFRNDLNQDQWNELMSSVRGMNSTKVEIKLLKELKTPETAEEIDIKIEELQNKVMEYLVGIYQDKAAYLLTWSTVENCVWDEELFFHCNPLYDVLGPNPLNGGLPLPNQAALVRERAINGTLERVHWLNLKLNVSNSLYVDQSIELDLWLRPDSENRYTGEVLLPSNVYFKNELGEPIQSYPYGIVQLKLE